MTTAERIARAIVHHLGLDGVEVTQEQAMNVAGQLSVWMDQEIEDRVQSFCTPPSHTEPTNEATEDNHGNEG